MRHADSGQCAAVAPLFYADIDFDTFKPADLLAPKNKSMRASATINRYPL